jgi:ATP-dependent Clp protease ATP-binding subunit ClpA
MPLSVPCAKAIARAKKIARFLGSFTILPEHFILAVLETKNAVTRFLRNNGILKRRLRAEAIGEIMREPRSEQRPEPMKSNRWNMVMARAAMIAKEGKRNSIGCFDVFAAFAQTDGLIECFFEACSAAYQKISEFLASLVAQERRYATP